MSKKIMATSFILMLVGLMVISCGKNVQLKEKEKQSPLNPNGDSELAIVMRTMMESGKQMKNEIENKLPPSAYPEEIKTITTAKPTDGMIEDRNVFNGFANFHMATLDSIYYKDVDQKVQFNHMVKSCVDCHENYCHGPIPAIKKLYISAR